MALRLTGEALERSATGIPSYLGVIIATTTKNNHDTATPFNDTGLGLGGKLLMLQPDTACWIKFGTVNTVTATASASDTNGAMYIGARERVEVNMPETYGWIACIAVTGTTNIKVWEMI